MAKNKQRAKEKEKSPVRRTKRKIEIKSIGRQVERELRKREASPKHGIIHASHDSKKKGHTKQSEREIENRQIILIITGLLLLFAVTMSFVYMYTHASNFMYKGMKFQRVNLEGIRAYQTVLTFTLGGQQVKYNHLFRFDPRKLDSIETNVTVLLRTRGFVTSEPRVSDCYASSLAFVELGTVLGALGMNIKGATTDAALAEEKELLHINCSDSKKSTVVLLRTADTSSVTQNGECYILNISKCETVQVAERFILEMLSQLIKRTENKK